MRFIRNWKRWLKLVLAFLYIIGMVSHVPLLFFGIANTITTLLVYASLIIIVWVLLNYLGKRGLKTSHIANLKIFLISFLLFLLLGEMTLKYVAKKNLTYKERTGWGYYVSPYRGIQFRQFIKKSENQGQVSMGIMAQPHSVKWNSGPEFSFRHSYNSFGLRDVEFVPKADNSDYLILALGDSFTEGIGTNQDSTWLKFLCNRLKYQYGNREIIGYNGGSAGSDPFFEFRKMENIGLQLRPDLVILSVNVGDVWDVLIRGGEDRFKDDGKMRFEKSPPIEYLYAFSFICRAVVHNILGYNGLLYSPEVYAEKDRFAKMRIADCIRKFHEMARQYDFQLIVVFHPTFHELYSGYFGLSDLVTELGKEGVMVLNMYDGFINSKKLNNSNHMDFYWPIDRHHNTKGYKLFGEILADYIRDQHIINEDGF